ncbi:retrovirus-related pol polyprotein from transposon TNT 1-94 [Tanacetum coccineum]
MNQFCRMKGIKREISVARTPQQNRVAKRKNMTLIEAARTMLSDSFLPTTFWAEVVNTACYVQNRVLVTRPHNKTPYELLHGRLPSISFTRPFGCPMTILNTLDPLGKFDRKADEGFLVGYSINSKALGSGPNWLFDIDLLTNSMNYEPVTVGNQTNGNVVADDAGKKTTEELANEGEINGQEKEGGTSNKEGEEVGLFPLMLHGSEPSPSPSRITSSPSHLSEPSTESTPAHTIAAESIPSLTHPSQPSPHAEQHIPTPHDSPIHAVHLHGSD